MNQLSPLLPITLAARRLGLSRQRLHILIRDNEFAVKKIGSTGYLKAEDVEILAKQKRKRGRPRKLTKDRSRARG